MQLLNSFTGHTDVSSFPFFDDVSDDVAAFTRKLDLLLTWSVTPLQFGDHRPYAAATLLRLWQDPAAERALRRDRESPHDLIQDQLFDWLDANEIAADADNLPNLALLFGQLVRRELFSYPQYIERLIARGEEGLSGEEVRPINCSCAGRVYAYGSRENSLDIETTFDGFRYTARRHHSLLVVE